MRCLVQFKFFFRINIQQLPFFLFPFYLMQNSTECYTIFRELIYDKPSKGPFDIFTGTPVIITRIEILRGANLGSLKSKGFGMKATSSPYCKVFCENNSCTGRMISDTSNPTWNEAFVFYRAKPNKQPIRIEVGLETVWKLFTSILMGHVNAT